MAGLMYLTQQLNPTPPNMDPVQMQVMKIMPVAISVIFIWLPSSLVLYSVANAAFSLVQQKMMYNMQYVHAQRDMADSLHDESRCSCIY